MLVTTICTVLKVFLAVLEQSKALILVDKGSLTAQECGTLIKVSMHTV